MNGPSHLWAKIGLTEVLRLYLGQPISLRQVREDCGFVHCCPKLIRLADGLIVNMSEGWVNSDLSGESENVAGADAHEDDLVQSVDPDKAISIWTDKKEYRIGDPISIAFTVKEPLHVQIIDITPDGEVTTLLPNSFQLDNYCLPGVEYHIPPDDGHSRCM